MNKISSNSPVDGPAPDAAATHDATPAKSSGMKRSFLLAVVLTVIAVAWIASGMLGENAEVAHETVAERNAHESETIRVRVADFTAVDHPRTLIVTGRTNAIKDAEIKAETAGQVVARPARKGTVVEKGTVLLELAMDDRAARLREAEARVGVARITYEASKDLQRKQFESQIKLAESNAELAAAEAALAAIRLDIQRTKIRAPIDGFIDQLLPGPGDYVSAGEQVAMVLDLDPMRVIVHVTERDVDYLKVDDLATIRLPSGREIGGTVHYISRTANEVTRAYRVDIWVDNPDASLPSGMTAEVRLNGGSRKAHQIPSSALTLNDLGQLGVRTVVGGDTVSFQPVKLLDDAPDGAWVAGLPDQVTVITVGQEFVVDGQKVTPSRGDAGAASEPKADGNS
ncbi:MAG: efflux RND transporter periplasmic adaptor subunit [Rhodospirillales bacterium]|nr:efflux RND transporter periplasmic adaptor subunit [Rhodospirillales bacterium]MBO6786089.1 efflux RND transporter periplasmic adaptor subunit [Rhodospirillales bacterium]